MNTLRKSYNSVGANLGMALSGVDRLPGTYEKKVPPVYERPNFDKQAVGGLAVGVDVERVDAQPVDIQVVPGSNE